MQQNKFLLTFSLFFLFIFLINPYVYADSFQDISLKDMPKDTGFGASWNYDVISDWNLMYSPYIHNNLDFKLWSVSSSFGNPNATIKAQFGILNFSTTPTFIGGNYWYRLTYNTTDNFEFNNISVSCAVILKNSNYTRDGDYKLILLKNTSDSPNKNQIELDFSSLCNSSIYNTWTYTNKTNISGLYLHFLIPHLTLESESLEDNILISDVTINGNYNSLPVINDIKINKTNLCAKNSTSLTYVFFNINVSDLENDNILYSIDNKKNIEYFTYLEEDFLLSSVTQCLSDGTFLLSDNVITNYTKVTNEALDVALQIQDYNNYLSVNHWQDNITDLTSCKGYISFYDDMQQPIYINLQSENIGFLQTTEQYLFYNLETDFNVSYIDTFLNTLVTINYNLTENGNLSIHIENNEVLNTHWVLNKYENLVYLNVYTTFNKTDNTILFTIFSTPDLAIFNINYGFDIWRYKYNLSNQTTYLKYLKYNSLYHGYGFFDSRRMNTYFLTSLSSKGYQKKDVIIWDNKPSYYLLNGEGFYTLTLYVTDDKHEGISYINKSFNIDLPVCSEYLEGYDFIGNEKDGISYTPNIDNEFVKSILIFFRIPRRIMDGLGIYPLFGLLSSVLLIYYLYDYWSKLNFNPEIVHLQNVNQTDIIKKVIYRAYYLVTLFYLVFVLIDKSVFVVCSVLAMLYLGMELLDSTKFTTENTTTEKRFLLGMSFFNLMSWLWFSFTQIMTGVKFGFAKLPSLNIFEGNLLENLKTWIKALFDIAFFTIPDLPDFLTYFLMALKFISFGMFVIYIYSLLPTVNTGS